MELFKVMMAHTHTHFVPSKEIICFPDFPIAILFWSFFFSFSFPPSKRNNLQEFILLQIQKGKKIGSSVRLLNYMHDQR